MNRLEKVKLHAFETFEDMERHQAKSIAEMNPIDGLRRTMNLILRVYGITREKLQYRLRNNTITIDRRE